MKKYFNSTATFLVIGCIATMLFIEGCNKINVNPPLTSPDAQLVYNNNASAAAVMTGLYSTLGSNISVFNANYDISTISGLTADELQAYPCVYPYISEAYVNALNAKDPVIWTQMYNYIYTCNAAIEGISGSSTISAAVKKQLLGEAEFSRAMFYFYMVNLFGDVPLILSTDYQKNATAARTPADQVYQQIILDLKNAQISLSSNFVAADAVTSTTERVRPTKWAAEALLARVYLYEKDYTSAYSASDDVIANSSLFSLVPLDSVFLANSNETIWQVQPTTVGFNTEDGYTFNLTTGPDPYSHFLSLSEQLVNAFEQGDKRFSQWVSTNTVNGITYYSPSKYKVGTYDATQNLTEYLMMLRLGELYLIRAEAQANSAGGGVAGAIADLNTIRKRAGLAVHSGANDQATILAAIFHEREVELFTEHGQRWLDLKRTGQVNAVMSVVTPKKGGTWNPNWSLYPIPVLTTIQYDPNIKQNPGY
jgi:starch-binding outer membrane protein, SusD/RagB family